MLKVNWKSITRDHVIKAIEIFLSENTCFPQPKNTFLIYNGIKLPAKHIRGMAYKVAFGKEISKNDFSGGLETVRFFEKLEFEVFYAGKSEKDDKKYVKTKKSKQGNTIVHSNVMTYIKNTSKETIRVSAKDVIEQKNSLQLLLNKIFSGDIVCEKTFSWMKTPDKIEADYENLYKALYEYCGDKDFWKKNVKLRCDFVCESEKLIIEYDERQHFSEARKVSLLAYPDVPLYYDKQLWIRTCDEIKAKDKNPVNRDIVRAFYDSIREIESSKHGYKLVRIMHGQIDFKSEGAEEKLRDLLNKKPVNIRNYYGNYRGGLKIGLYLQTDELKNKVDFEKVLEVVKKSDFDILFYQSFVIALLYLF